MMKPSGILLFMISVFLLLIAVALYFPKNGIQISPDLRLHFFSPAEILAGNREEYADISEILRMQTLLSDTMLEEYASYNPSADTAGASIDKLLAGITRIEYPDGDSSILYPFFSSLKDLETANELVRILHYGDSQIEDDRITSYLRNKLQTRFGGSGVGLVPVAPFYPYGFSMTQTNSDNWYRYVVCGNRDTTLTHDRYGALGGFGTYIPENNLVDVENETVEAWVRFSPSYYSYQNTKRFKQCRIFYGFNNKPFIIEIQIRDSLIDAEMLPASREVKMMQWEFDEPQEELMLKFKGNASPEIYGIALDDASGIAVRLPGVNIGASNNVALNIDTAVAESQGEQPLLGTPLPLGPASSSDGGSNSWVTALLVVLLVVGGTIGILIAFYMIWRTRSANTP